MFLTKKCNLWTSTDDHLSVDSVFFLQFKPRALGGFCLSFPDPVALPAAMASNFSQLLQNVQVWKGKDNRFPQMGNRYAVCKMNAERLVDSICQLYIFSNMPNAVPYNSPKIKITLAVPGFVKDEAFSPEHPQQYAFHTISDGLVIKKIQKLHDQCLFVNPKKDNGGLRCIFDPREPVVAMSATGDVLYASPFAQRLAPDFPFSKRSKLFEANNLPEPGTSQ